MSAELVFLDHTIRITPVAWSCSCGASGLNDGEMLVMVHGHWVDTSTDNARVLRELRDFALAGSDGVGIRLSAHGWRELVLRLTGGES